MDRCNVTGNPCGTDTWIEGHSCPCENCQRWLSESIELWCCGDLYQTRDALHAHERVNRIHTDF